MEQSEAISIHALRKESDFGFRGSVAGKHISIHALRKESDRKTDYQRPAQRFQSTLSVRRATLVDYRLEVFDSISIHALRKESDVIDHHAVANFTDFNPRSP